MRLLLVRHGETEQNIAGCMQGHQPGVLTERGKTQAQALASRLKDEVIHYAFTSDLARAIDTAEFIRQFHPNLTIEPTPAIRERALGIYEGQPGHLYYEGFVKSGAERTQFKPEGGESILDVLNRTNAFLEKIRALPTDSNILICTHGGVITTLLATLLDGTAEEMLSYNFRNCSITIVDINNNVISLKAFNSIDHMVGIEVVVDKSEKMDA